MSREKRMRIRSQMQRWKIAALRRQDVYHLAWKRAASHRPAASRFLSLQQLVDVEHIAIGGHDEPLHLNVIGVLLQESDRPIAEHNMEIAIEQPAELRQRLLLIEGQIRGFRPDHRFARFDNKRGVRRAVGNAGKPGLLLWPEQSLLTGEDLVEGLAGLRFHANW